MQSKRGTTGPCGAVLAPFPRFVSSKSISDGAGKREWNLTSVCLSFVRNDEILFRRSAVPCAHGTQQQHWGQVYYWLLFLYLKYTNETKVSLFKLSFPTPFFITRTYNQRFYLSIKMQWIPFLPRIWRLSFTSDNMIFCCTKNWSGNELIHLSQKKWIFCTCSFEIERICVTKPLCACRHTGNGFI